MEIAEASSLAQAEQIKRKESEITRLKRQIDELQKEQVRVLLKVMCITLNEIRLTTFLNFSFFLSLSPRSPCFFFFFLLETDTRVSPSYVRPCNDLVRFCNGGLFNP